MFANGGFAVTPYLIQKVVDGRGAVLFEAKPPPVAQEADRVLDARNAFVTTSLLHEVTISGTGAALQKLGRPDLAGKTGTSSEAVDGWFAGFAGPVTAVAWMGYDEPQSLGGREFGATLALPIWSDFMAAALKGKPPYAMAQPAGVSQQQGDWMYDEFQGNAATRTIDLDLMDRLKELFGSKP